jgi:hypothetical protein
MAEGNNVFKPEQIEQLANAMITHGIPEHIRSDNGPEFIAKGLRNGYRA